MKNRGMTFDRVEEGVSPRIYAGDFSAPGKVRIPIVRFSAGMANSRAKARSTLNSFPLG